jgi:dolichyl-diphosphooligosaccharide--protein glycosyltransferase
MPSSLGSGSRRLLACPSAAAGYSSDDINKFLWMVRIGGGVYPDHIKESNYLAGVGGQGAAACCSTALPGSKGQGTCLAWLRGPAAAGPRLTHGPSLPALLQGNDYTVSSKGTDTMFQSLMYKLSYFDFDKIMTMQVGGHVLVLTPAAPWPLTPHPWPLTPVQNQPTGYDRVRGYEIGHKGFKLEHHEEAFTSQNWIVRIYSVQDLQNRW